MDSMRIRILTTRQHRFGLLCGSSLAFLSVFPAAMRRPPVERVRTQRRRRLAKSKQ